MQERAAGAAGAVDDFFGQDLKVVAVVVVLFADDVDQARPSAAQADHLIALAQRAEGDGADGGVQAGHVAASGEDSDDTLFRVYVCHFGLFLK